MAKVGRPPAGEPRQNILKELRHKARLTQRELAEKMGLSEAAICRHENHQRHIDDETATHYQEVLGGCFKQP